MLIVLLLFAVPISFGLLVSEQGDNIANMPNAKQPENFMRRVTIVDVAKHAGVSTATASRVLRDAYGVSDAMKDRVQRSIDELGFRPSRPARGMRGHTFTVGMLVSDIENPFFDLLFNGAKSVLGNKGYEILVAPGGYSSASQIETIYTLVDHQMDGMLLVAPVLTQTQLAHIAEQVPVVTVGYQSSNNRVDSVAGDDLLAAELVVDHLVELGHTHIAFIANPRKPEDEGRPETVRLKGFVEAMRRRGLEDSAAVINGVWSQSGGEEAARQILSMSKMPTAIHAGADVTAFGVLSELWRNGINIPSDISLVGHDNSQTSSIGPIALTTIDQSGYAMGTRAAELLLERIGGRNVVSSELTQPRLIVRGTTAKYC